MDRTSEDMINMMLKQKGAAKLKSIPTYVNTVKFVISKNLKLVYIYEIEKNDGIYLQRVKPYPLMIGKLYSPDDVIDFIERDVEKFRDAFESENFPKLIVLANQANSLERKFEKMFLNESLRSEKIKKLEKAIEEVERIVDEE